MIQMIKINNDLSVVFSRCHVWFTNCAVVVTLKAFCAFIKCTF
jgi:hypothetical protein